MTGLARLGRFTMVASLALLFLVICASLFVGIPVLDREYVLANADPNDYARLLGDPGWREVLADGPASEASELHRKATHHFAYVVVGSVIHHALEAGYRLLGIPGAYAAYGVNAVIGLANVLLLALLLKRIGAPTETRIPLVAVYAVCVSTLLYASIPDSWLFSGTIVLASTLLVTVRAIPSWVIGAFIGVGMTANFLLVICLAALIPRAAGGDANLLATGRRLLSWGAATLIAWIAVSAVLALAISPDLGVDRVLGSAFGFRAEFPVGLSIWSPTRWAYAAANVFIVPIVGNHDDLHFGWRAFRSTLLHPVGLLSILVFLTLVVRGLARTFITMRARLRERSLTAVLEMPETGWLVLAAGAAGMAATTVYYEAALYSPVAVPAVLVAMASGYRAGNRLDRVLLLSLPALVAIDTAQTTWRIREQLIAMGS